MNTLFINNLLQTKSLPIQPAGMSTWYFKDTDPILQVLYMHSYPWIPTVLRPRSEHFPDIMASSLVCIMFGFSGLWTHIKL